MLDQVEYDHSGKIILKDIYNEENPISYFSELHELDYQIPQNAKPIFQRLIEMRRAMTGDEAIKLIDVGCSYGVNGALLKYGLSMNQLYQMYDVKQNQDPEDMIRRDKQFYAVPLDPALEIVGLDTAEHAIDYAVRNGLLDDGFTTNLEKQDPLPKEADAVENADMIISTGCIGYVTEHSLERLLEASGNSQPWMAHFVLRMFDFEGSQDMLSRHGYVTEKLDGLFRQRRFVSDIEQQNVLDNLQALGVDPTGAEEDGWYLAELFVSRPQVEARDLPLEAVLKAEMRQ
jgi:carnitine O-acetyltransferase